MAGLYADQGTLLILAVLVVAVLGKANSVAVAAALLLILRLVGLDKPCYPLIREHGFFWGLVLLTAAVMVPLASGEYAVGQILGTMRSTVGMVAFAASLFTTYLSGRGAIFLLGGAHIMPSLILGAVVAAAFLRGVPVGPLVTAGLVSLFTGMGSSPPPSTPGAPPGQS